MDIGQASRQNLAVKLPAAACILTLLCVSPATAQSDEDYVERQRRMTDLHIVDLVETWLRATRIPGGAVALVEEEHLLFLEGFGNSDSSRRSKVDPRATLFRAGALVRVLTATLALRMAEQGALDLDSDITRLTSLVDGSLGPLTIRQLLLHTGGIDQRRIATRVRQPDDLLSLADYLARRMPARVRPADQLSVPSDHGYALVGRLCELVTGRDFAPLLAENVLVPFGMSNTLVATSAVPNARIAAGHRWLAERWTTVWPDLAQTTPASTLLTSAQDMSLWMRAVLGGGSVGGRRLLRSRDLSLLIDPQFRQLESLPGRTLALREGRSLNSREIHLSSVENGTSALLVLLPERRIGLFVAFNGEIDLWGLAKAILEPFDSPRQSPVEADSSEPGIDFDPRGIWRDTSVSLATPEKLVGLVRQDVIARVDGDALVWRQRIFHQESPSCFREPSTGARLCLVRPPGSRPLAMIGDLVLEKLAWYESRTVQILLWVTFTSVFLAAGWFRYRPPHRHAALLGEDPPVPHWPLTLARLAAALHFVFIVALVVVLATLSRDSSAGLLYEVPPYAPWVLILPLIGGVLTAVAAVGLVPVWRAGPPVRFLRLYLASLLVFLLAFLPFLWHWNLLGFRV